MCKPRSMTVCAGNAMIIGLILASCASNANETSRHMDSEVARWAEVTFCSGRRVSAIMSLARTGTEAERVDSVRLLGFSIYEGRDSDCVGMCAPNFVVKYDHQARKRAGYLVPILVMALSDTSEEVRLGAIDALVNMRWHVGAAYTALSAMIGDPSAAVRERAERALEYWR